MRAGAILLTCCLLTAITPSSRAGQLRIDSARSFAQFSVRLLWIKRIHGRFTRISGTLIQQSQDGPGVVDASIDVNSAQMPQQYYRRRLLAPAFFDAATYPSIHFVSAPVPLTRLTHGGPLHGNLTLRGVTRPVDFHLRPSQCPQPRTQPCAITVTGHIRRSQFGMHAHRALLSDHVQLTMVIVLTPAP